MNNNSTSRKTVIIIGFCGLLFHQIYFSTAQSVVPCNSDGWIHKCLDGSCIPDMKVCDGVKDCPDGSDERNYADVARYKNESGIECTRKTTQPGSPTCFLPEKNQCDQYNHCLEDECDCPNSKTFHCSATECIQFDWFCDGVSECNMGQDEIIYSSPLDGVKCMTDYSGNACALPKRYRCDGKNDCVTKGDECFCGNRFDEFSEYDNESIFDQTCFRCLDGMGEMKITHMCNGFFDCADLSDECLCDNPLPTCKQLTYNDDCEFECRKNVKSGDQSSCINKIQICDGNRDCFFGEDEKYCPHVHTLKTNINLHYDVDQPEMWCCNAGYPADCMSNETYTNDTHDGCDQFYVCPQHDLFAAYMKYAIKCDGIPTCVGFDDECKGCEHSSNRPTYCEEGKKKGFVCPNDPTSIQLFPSDMCDGYPRCNYSHPRESADEVNCTDRMYRFYCFADVNGEFHVSISKARVCDCTNDCRDGSDEEHCPSWSNFCCKSGEGGVTKDKICNGIEDCADGSDECNNCFDSPFADDENLISNKVLSAFVWIIGLASSFGNVYVLSRTSFKIAQGKQSSLTQMTSVHIIALSVADLCVGIYLLCLGAVNAIYNGTYCYKDLVWRSSRFCNFMGVLSMFGLEASVFMLTYMTMNRLYIIYRPFKTVSMRVSVSIIILLIIAAIFLALIPIFPISKDYFISHVRLHTNPFLQRDVNRKEFSHFANKMLTYGTEQHNFSNILQVQKVPSQNRMIFTNGSLGADQTYFPNSSQSYQEIYPWNSLYDMMRHLNSSFGPKHEFGYYSSHGVCLPKFFPETTDPAWQYSLFLICVNFVSFFVICVAYTAIYRKTVETRLRAGKSDEYYEQARRIERKITRIIITDFICWMPICIIAFLKLNSIQISDEVYAIAAIIILPINSAINPFLYSNLPDAIVKRVGKAYGYMQSDAARSRETDQTNVERNGNGHSRHSSNAIPETKL